MKYLKRFIFLCLTVGALFSGSSSQAAFTPAKDRTVIVISIDGFPWWVWTNSSLAVPTLRRLAAEGASGRMKVSNPSITWINHTTLVTGVEPAKHGVLYNGLLVHQGANKPPKIEQWASKDRLVHAPTVYDLAHDAGLTTAQVDWVAITNSPAIDWNFFEIPDTKGDIGQEMVKTGIVTQAELDGFAKGTSITWRDMVWTKAAAHIVRTHQPNLLLYHPLTTDAVNHAYGPGTMASLTAYSYADRMVEELLNAVAASPRADRTTVFIVTDHGFKSVKQVVLPNVALKQAGLVRAAGPSVSSCDAWVMAQGGMAFVYVTDREKRAELVPKLKEMFGKMEGVATVLEPKDYAQWGMPAPEQNDGAGDLALFAKDGYAFKSELTGDAVVTDSENYKGTHGYPNTDPQLDGVFIAWGYGIKHGVKMEKLRNLDVAPTIAELLGVKFGSVDGEVLQGILQP